MLLTQSPAVVTFSVSYAFRIMLNIFMMSELAYDSKRYVSIKEIV